MKLNLYHILCTLSLLLPFTVIGQTTGDYRTKSSGSWTSSTDSIWEIYNGTSWEATTTSPTASDGTIVITSGQNVIIDNNSSITVDQTIVSAGAVLTINNGSTLVVKDNGTSSTDLSINNGNSSFNAVGQVIVNGILEATQSANITSDAAKLTIGSTGVYRHNYQETEGAIPIATWSAGSTLYITGYTSIINPPLNLEYNFSNVVWDTPNLTIGDSHPINLQGKFKNIGGSLSILNTGARSVSLSNFDDYLLTIGEDLNIGENALVYFSYIQPSATIVVGRNFNIKTNKLLAFTEDSDFFLTVKGNLYLEGTGLVELATANDPTIDGYVNLEVQGSTHLKNGKIQKTAARNSDVILKNVSVENGANVTFTDISVNVQGEWVNNGGVFAGSASDFSFTGTNQNIQSSNQPFGNVTFAFDGIKNATDNLNIDGNITITDNATFNLNSAQVTASVAGDWINNFSTFQPNGGTVNFDGADQNIGLSSPFHNIIISGTGTKSLLDVIHIDGNLTIHSTLDVTNVDKLFIGGNWINDGNFVANTSEVILNGSGTQLISGSISTNFNDIYVTNISTNPSVRVTSSQNLFGNLKLSEGAIFAIDDAADFILKSTSSTTASIGMLINGAAVIGNVVVQRFIHGEGILFRYLATSVEGATFNDLADNMTISLSNPKNVYRYDETIDGVADNGWVAYPNALSDIIEVGKGYAIEILEGSADIIADIKGPVTQNSVTIPLSFTASSVPEGDGWNLVGNPYPSTIDWNSIWSKGNTVVIREDIEPSIWIPNNESGSLVYASYNAKESVGLNRGSAYIASGQGFWVKATTATNISIEEQYKANLIDTEFFKIKQPEDVLIVGVTKGSVLDETALIFRSDATTGFDQGRDVRKLKNATFNLSSLGEDHEDLAYNVLPWHECSRQIPLFLDYAAAGNYTFSFRSLDSFKRAVSFILFDKYEGKEIQVSSNSTYNFSVSSDEKSYGKDRFVLQAAYQPLAIELPFTAEAICLNEQAKVIINGAQKDVQYQAYLGGAAMGEAGIGDGDVLELLFPTAALATGEHTVTVTAKRYSCETNQLTNTASFHISDTYNITQSEGAATCGEGTVTLSVQGAPADGVYRWYASADAMDVLAETATASFTTPVLSETTSYFVAIANATGCEGSRTKITAEVSQGLKPEISLSNDKLTATIPGVYQWYKDGELIKGESSSSITPHDTGTYYAILTTDACQTVSNEYLYEITGLEDLSQLGLTVWPTPANDYLYIKHNKQTSSGLRIRVISIEGKQLLLQRTYTGAGYVHSLNIQNMKSGMYLLELEQDSNVVRVRIVKH